MISLIDHYNFETLFGVQIDLLRLGDFFQQFDDDYTIKVADVGRGDLEVIYRSNDIELYLAI